MSPSSVYFWFLRLAVKPNVAFVIFGFFLCFSVPNTPTACTSGRIGTEDFVQENPSSPKKLLEEENHIILR